MDWSWATWLVSVGAVVISAAAAWRENCWVRRPGLDMGFVDHGGMWGDLILLPIANGVIVPHLTIGPWIAPAVIVATLASVWVHQHWHCRNGGRREGGHSREHMWPSRPKGTWHGDLSRAGWLHVLYVIGELSILIGFLAHSIPSAVVLVVAAVLTIHVPIGLLQPRWFLTHRVATLQQQPLLVPCLATLWIVAAVKM